MSAADLEPVVTPARTFTADEWQRLFKAYAGHVAACEGVDMLHGGTDVQMVAEAAGVDVDEFRAFVNAMQVERYLAAKGKKS